MAGNRKTVLFFPLNSPGHINASIGVADQLKKKHNFRVVFLLLGPSIGTTIEEHGHELITLEERQVFEDYELSDEEDQVKTPKGSKEKKKFPGASKWGQVVQRYRGIMRLEPLEACVLSMPIMERLMVDELIENHDSYQKAIESVKPDLLIIDAYYVPPCVVNMKQTPWVRLYSANPLGVLKPAKEANGIKPPHMVGFRLLKNKEERDKLRIETPDKWQAMQAEWTQAWGKILEAAQKGTGHLQEFMAAHGCEPIPSGQLAHDSPHLNIYMFPKVIDYVQETDLFQLPKRWIGCDSLMRSMSSSNRDAQFWCERLDAAEAAQQQIVFFSLGTIASGDVTLIKRYINLFKTDSAQLERKRLYIISKGINGDQIDLDEDNNNIVGDNYVPQPLILERSHLAIVHGGNNSITECLYKGVPMLLVPSFADQLDNAQRIEDLELGKRLNLYNCTRDELLDAINDTLSNQSLAQRFREISSNMQARDDTNKICLMLKKLVEDGSLEESFIEECREKEAHEV